jgi:hypothetical protein
MNAFGKSYIQAYWTAGMALQKILRDMVREAMDKKNFEAW